VQINCLGGVSRMSPDAKFIRVLTMLKTISSIVIFSLIIGCEQSSDVTEPSEDYKRYDLGTTFAPSIFSSAFESGYSEFVDGKYHYTYSITEVGALNIQSGKLVICEPLYFYDEVPVNLEINPGKYKVYLSESIISEGNKVIDKRNAFAKIVLNSGEAVEWEYIWTFGADGGTGGYIDFSTLTEIVEKGDSEPFSNRLLKEFNKVQRIIEPFHDNYDNYHSFVNLEYGEGNLVAFSSGWGDGAYNSFLGKDKNGVAVEILTDLGVASWEPEENLVRITSN